MTYNALLVDPDGSPLPLLPGADGNVVFPMTQVQRGGLYLLVIQGTTGSGDLIIEIASEGVEPVPLAMGQTPVSLLDQPVRYRLIPPAGATGPTYLAVEAVPLPDASPEPGLPAVTLADEAGYAVIVDLPRGGPSQVSLALPSLTVYLLVLSPADGPAQAVITWTDASPGAPPTATPAALVPAPTATLAASAPAGEGPQAPEDARFNAPLTIPLDGAAVTGDVVSYPGGDVEDRIQFDVTGLNPSPGQPGGRALLQIAAACTGTGTDYVQFSTGGQTFACGQTLINREVTYDNRAGSVIVTAAGGQDTYVEWSLSGAATRVN
jgi:hypothetical protein